MPVRELHPARVDLAIVGSGFAGSLMAMVGKRLGLSVALLESGRHPRFVIGESSTPLANLLLEELSTRYDLPQISPLSRWKSWQDTYPAVGCGLKRGFTFYHHRFGYPFERTDDRRNELLVAASPHDGVADTHWYRPDFDHLLVREAERIGVHYLDETKLDVPSWSDNRIVISGNRQGTPLTIEAKFLIDATGPRGYLYRALGLAEVPFEHLPPTQGLYTHFRKVAKFGDMTQRAGGESPPFPVDDAAVHHVFDGGWIWVLRFNNGITSAGVTAEDSLADELRLTEGVDAWQRLMKRLPAVAEQFGRAEALFPFVHAPRLSFQSAHIKGRHWVMLPSAAGFTDPLLSTGFPLALLGIQRLARILEDKPGTEAFDERLELYAARTRRELLAAEHLLAALFANMHDFELFTSLALLYFAAASYTEAAYRLGRPETAGSFLMHDHPEFGPRSRNCIRKALQPMNEPERATLLREIRRTIEPRDVAGLCHTDRRNWYPVLAEDLLDAAPKLGVSRSEIEELLERTGFFEG